MRNYRFKLIWGQSSMLHRGYRTPQYSQGGVNTEFQTLQLYDLKLDPGEKRNIATRRKHILQKFQRLAMEFYSDIVPPRFGISQSTIQVIIICARTSILRISTEFENFYNMFNILDTVDC